MWIKKQFFDPFFFLSGPFQGGHFFGGIIYLAALDLGPIALMIIYGPLPQSWIQVAASLLKPPCGCFRSETAFT